MKFESFKMAQFSAQWPTGSVENMHSSNPQPLSWDELSLLLDADIPELLQQAPLAYESTQGDNELRALLCIQYYNQLTAKDVVLTSGAQEGIFLVMNALLKPGDHVVAFSPCFEPLVTAAKETGADVSVLPLNETAGWKIDWQQLEATITHQTKLLVINFPHNPTGTHISQDELDKLVDLCRQHGCWLFSDEVFRGLEHDKADRLPAAADLYEQAISMGVVSKALALPGIRVGWLSSQHTAFLDKVMTIKSHLSICQSSLDVQLCKAIIPSSKLLWERSVKIILTNKALVGELIKQHKSMVWHPPSASATCFVQCPGQDVSSMANKWANEHQLMVLPNIVFLTEQPGFRLTLGKSETAENYKQIIKL